MQSHYTQNCQLSGLIHSEICVSQDYMNKYVHNIRQNYGILNATTSPLKQVVVFRFQLQYEFTRKKYTERLNMK